MSGYNLPVRRSINTAETTGILVIAAIILVIALLRWGAHIPWSAR